MKNFLFLTIILIQTFALSFQTEYTLQDNLYYFKCKANKHVLDIENEKITNGINLIVYKYHSGTNQHFHLTNVGQDYVTLVADNSNLALTAVDGPGVKIIQQFPLTGSNTQLFKFIKTKDGYYMIQNQETGLFIDCNSSYQTPHPNRFAILTEKQCTKSFKFSVHKV